MQVTVRNAYEETSYQPECRIVIDVFRASTTTIALAETGLKSLFVANDFGLVSDLCKSGYQVISEVFDLGIDNSPTMVKKRNFDNQLVVLKTANMTTAIEKNFFSGLMIIACFNNLSAVVRFVKEKGFQSIEILPAGSMEKNQPNVEDSHCAEILQARLTSNTPVEANRPLLLKHIHDVEERKNPPQHYLDDIRLAIETDISSVVPTLHNLQPGLFQVNF